MPVKKNIHLNNCLEWRKPEGVIPHVHSGWSWAWGRSARLCSVMPSVQFWAQAAVWAAQGPVMGTSVPRHWTHAAATFAADSEHRVRSANPYFLLNEIFLETGVGSAYQKLWFPVAWASPYPIDPATQKHCIMLNSARATMPLAKWACLVVSILPTWNPVISRSNLK